MSTLHVTLHVTMLTTCSSTKLAYRVIANQTAVPHESDSVDYKNVKIVTRPNQALSSSGPL